MTNPGVSPDVPLSHLPAEEKAKRASSFGAEAAQYERFRPGPPAAAVDWMVPQHVHTIVDLGAGTGALTRQLIDRADEVIAVEPDDRMRAVLTKEVPGARAVDGRGDSMPIPDGTVDAVLASSSWHWMDLVPTLHEVGRVLVPGGTLGVVWSGPDPDGPFLEQAVALMRSTPADGGAGGTSPSLADLVVPDTERPPSIVEIPAGVPFDQPEKEIFRWDLALNADELIGLLGTFSWMITMDEEPRTRLVNEARRLLNDVLGIKGDVTVDVTFRAEAYRVRRHT